MKFLTATEKIASGSLFPSYLLVCVMNGLSALKSVMFQLIDIKPIEKSFVSIGYWTTYRTPYAIPEFPFYSMINIL